MHLFRSVFIFAAATLALVANQALEASAFPFGILPLTRYMLDAVPEGAEGPAAAEAATIQGGGPLVDAPDAVSSSIDLDAAPSAVETSEETPTSTQLVEFAQESSVNSEVSTLSSAAVATESTVATSTEPSSVIPENIRAKANSAERIVGLGGPLLITSVLTTVVFVL